MKRLRLERWSGQLHAPARTARTRPCCLRQQHVVSLQQQSIRSQSNSAAADIVYEDEQLFENEPSIQKSTPTTDFPSPLPSAAHHSAKLAALHARLSLPKKIPLQTMARTLVDPSADSNTQFNNASLAQIGSSIMSYHVSEFLLCTYPRLPMTVLFAAAYAYNGPKTLQMIAHEWGVEAAAAPGSEVDPGLLQFSKLKPGTSLRSEGSMRPDKSPNWRRGVSSRVVYDDEFGDTIPKEKDESQPLATETAYAGFVRAVVGAIYLHSGREAAKTFVKQHILSRHLDISSLFAFKDPVRELARLCSREDFEFPVARILSETGRLSRTPVFVVGIFSGKDKLGEGAGPSLQEARIRASVAALKSWYLYSPGGNARVPSDMERPNGNREWEAVHVDIGEIIH